LTDDGLVDLDDRDTWLAEAGGMNLGPGQAYLLGDANLDGLDFVDWNDNKFTSLAAWCAGDFNADGVVDGLDFTIWNDNKFQSSAGSMTQIDTSRPHAQTRVQVGGGRTGAPRRELASGSTGEFAPEPSTSGVYQLAPTHVDTVFAASRRPGVADKGSVDPPFENKLVDELICNWDN
ncbi:unnamed protein product, partial [marine sediment metagenome]